MVRAILSRVPMALFAASYSGRDDLCGIANHRFRPDDAEQEAQHDPEEACSGPDAATRCRACLTSRRCNRSRSPHTK